MHQKISMRIFWLSLSLLLVSGVVIIIAVQVNSHKKPAESQQEVVQDEKASTDAERDVQQPMDVRAGSPTAENSSQASAGKQQAQPAGRNLPEYTYELKADNGYLEVYYYHTKRLFFHTGIPERVLTSTQREELSKGKYFKNEQELYGYLESCTS